MAAPNALESLTDELTENAPTVNETIVSSVLSENNTENSSGEGVGESVSPTPVASNPAPSTPIGPKDASGEVFNPALHCTMEDGVTPRYTAKGNFRRRRGAANTSSVSPATTAQMVDYGATGQMLAGLFFGLTTGTLGPDWEPSNDERTQITQATIRYCEANAVEDLPPNIALVLAVSIYAIPRINLPSTKERFALLLGRKPKNKPNNAYNNTGDDGIRENNPSDIASEHVAQTGRNGSSVRGTERPTVGMFSTIHETR